MDVISNRYALTELLEMPQSRGGGRLEYPALSVTKGQKYGFIGVESPLTSSPALPSRSPKPEPANSKVQGSFCLRQWTVQTIWKYSGQRSLTAGKGRRKDR
jgi:hypothetical protein